MHIRRTLLKKKHFYLEKSISFSNPKIYQPFSNTKYENIKNVIIVFYILIEALNVLDLQ